MPFKRRVSKQTDTPITPRMISIFDRMRYASGKRYDDLHDEIWALYQAELSARTGRTRPWEWPLCVNPRFDLNPYPAGTPAHLSWQPDLRAQEMWQALVDASREAREARRVPRNGSTDQPPSLG
jgi:hypothetical protein